MTSLEASGGDRERICVVAGTYDDQVTTSAAGPVVLRNGVGIEDPLSVVLDILRAYRRLAIEEGLRAIVPDASLAGTADSVPWRPLRQVFDAFADIRGVGFAKMTKALHPKRRGEETGQTADCG